MIEISVWWIVLGTMYSGIISVLFLCVLAGSSRAVDKCARIVSMLKTAQSELLVSLADKERQIVRLKSVNKTEEHAAEKKAMQNTIDLFSREYLQVSNEYAWYRVIVQSLGIATKVEEELDRQREDGKRKLETASCNGAPECISAII